MIPILFESYATNFATNGIGRLSDCVSCVVTEERNGIYECKFEYPITGKWYDYLRERGGTVLCIHDDQKDVQPFDIYGYTAPIDGVVTFYAHHISYRLNYITVAPFTATSVADAFSQISPRSYEANPFTFWTDKTTAGDFKLDHPENIRPLLGGQRGSILDVYGKGDYKFDNFYVRLYASRGVDSGVTIRYGKNLADMTVEYDKSETYNTIRPYWKGTDGTVVIAPAVQVLQTLVDPWTDENGNYITDENGTGIEFEHAEDSVVVTKDFSSEFEEIPTEQQLIAKAESFLQNNQPWIPKKNITVDFVQLWQTKEYADVAALQRVGLCDRVSIYYPELGVTAENQKVIRVVYNVLNERFDEMELGEPKTSLADDIRNTVREEFEELTEDSVTQSVMKEAIDHATELITGGLGGHVVFTMDANGKPQEILIMDTADVQTAVNVLRINQNGIGFSSNGYQGPYRSAWTLDGSFVADFITAGHLTANMIQGGVLTLGGLDNGNGVMRLLDSTGQQVGIFNKDGIEATAGQIGGWRITSTGLDNTVEDRPYTTKLGVQIDSGSSSIQFMSYADVSPYVNTGLFIGKDPDNFSRQSIIFQRASQGVTGNLVKIYATPYQNHSSFYIKLQEPGIFGVGYQDDTIFQVGCYVNSSDQYVNINATDCEVHNLNVYGDLHVRGTKDRLIETEHFGSRCISAYETACPYFGDLGQGKINEDGECIVPIEEIFSEMVDLETEYQVFLQKEGPGDLWVEHKNSNAFTVKGTPGLKFAWELKAKQIDHDNCRLEEFTHEDRRSA